MNGRRRLLAALAAGPLLARADGLNETLARVQRAWRPRLAWRADPTWRTDALATARRLILLPGDDGSTLQGQSAFSMAHPGLAAELDHPDVAALIAPRPLLLFGSPEDKLFPWDAVQATWAGLARAWPRPGAISTRLTTGGHRFDSEQQQAAIAWLERVG
ncbi:hypothetical protein [Roseateles sp.]|uniref:hypothetical protein n=1 Tax=Roseateles sp. TaxID=1971397 RepID=UPI003263138A